MIIFPILPAVFAQISSLSEKLNQRLALTAEQQKSVDPIADRHQAAIDVISRRNGPKEEMVKERRALRDEILPFLTDAQKKVVDDVLDIPKESRRFTPGVGVEYELFFPSGKEARDIFGSSNGSFGLAIGTPSAELGNRVRFDVTFSTFSLDNDGNKLFVLSPQAILEYRAPISHGLYGFGDIAVGPSYMDYSFNDPNGSHFGAKRLGADADAEVGLRYGQFRVSMEYREFTQPAGINFSGFQAALQWIVVRF